MPAGSLRSSNTDRPRGGSLTVLTNIAPCLRPQLRRILGRRFQCNSSLIELQSPLLYNDMVVILSNELGKYGGRDPRLDEILWIGRRESRVHHVLVAPRQLSKLSETMPHVWRSSCGDQDIAQHLWVLGELQQILRRTDWQTEHDVDDERSLGWDWLTGPASTYTGGELAGAAEPSRHRHRRQILGRTRSSPG